MEPNQMAQYEPPAGRDLSGYSASGDEVEGGCYNGWSPYHACVGGSVFTTTCNPGTYVDTSACSIGAAHLDPACFAGHNADTACKSGQNQQL